MTSPTRFTVYRSMDFNAENWAQNTRPCGMNDMMRVKPKPFTDRQIDEMAELAYMQGFKFILVFDEEALQTIAIARKRD